MKIEEIKKDRINELHDLLAELAAHHNAVSADFKGDFPRRPIGDVLKNFAESLDEGTSHIAAALGWGQDSRLLQSGHFGG